MQRLRSWMTRSTSGLPTTSGLDTMGRRRTMRLPSEIEYAQMLGRLQDAMALILACGTTAPVASLIVPRRTKTPNRLTDPVRWL